MGYTHYFNFMAPKLGDADKIERAYQRALKQCATLCFEYNLCMPGPERLSGYSAHCKPGRYGGLMVNGKGEEGHEPLALREHYRQNIGDMNGFVKTARKPYDVVVTACLLILKAHLGDRFEIGSDGFKADWVAGLQLAAKYSSRKVAIPDTIKSKALLKAV